MLTGRQLRCIKGFDQSKPLTAIRLVAAQAGSEAFADSRGNGMGQPSKLVLTEHPLNGAPATKDLTALSLRRLEQF